MYSQNKEEQYITEYFKDRVGKFIDIGAFHATHLSNTRRLYELGWNGVLVEPAPQNYQALAEHYKDEPRIKVLNFAVGNSNEDLDFYTSNGDAVSTSVESHKTKWESGGVKFEKITVPQMHVFDFMEEYLADTLFLSIDTEATNMQIFHAIPDSVWNQIEMFCIEHDNAIVEIVGKLGIFGFKTDYINAENIILSKNR